MSSHRFAGKTNFVKFNLLIWQNKREKTDKQTLKPTLTYSTPQLLIELLRNKNRPHELHYQLKVCGR